MGALFYKGIGITVSGNYIFRNIKIFHPEKGQVAITSFLY